MSCFQRLREKWSRVETHVQKGRFDVPNLMFNPGSPLHCDKCDYPLGIWHSVRSAMFKKQGEQYFIKCKDCGYLNPRVKGQLKHDLEKNWSDE